MTKIKLCGLMRQQDIAVANALRPEYVGFVFAPKSRRYVAPETVREWRGTLSEGIRAVGVFVDAPVEEIAACLTEGIIDIAQLHGHETGEQILALQRLTGKPIIKAFSVERPEDIAAACASEADYVLLDSGKGGTGTSFDWSLLKEMNRPFFLAGGLNPENVEQALRQCSPFAVDVSSGIETDGVKDAEKMKRFVKNVREKERQRDREAGEDHE
ncbi:MAG: phosphoribosylanthranilate isomerase [Acetatifactor sp.]